VAEPGDRFERTCKTPGCSALVLFVEVPASGYCATITCFAVCEACGAAQRFPPARQGSDEMHWLDK
jgi:hypothetical protein